MINNNFNELNSMFWNSLDNEKISKLDEIFNSNHEIYYSPILRELISEILKRREYSYVLIPAFNMGTSITFDVSIIL